jgi:zinc-ribbon domain
MFCPRCGTENTSEQSFCRHCGLSLLGARLSLEGRADEALTKIKKGMNALSGALTAVAIFIPIVVVALLSMGKLNILNFALCMSILFGVTIPFVLNSLVRFWRVERLFRLSAKSLNPLTTGSKETNALPGRIDGQVSIPKAPIHISATEGTTLTLDSKPKDG